MNKTVLVVGSGPIIIGQAAEFDYAGAQACKSLREEGYRVVLINSNPATIMTDTEMADRIYIEPITPEIVENRGWNPKNFYEYYAKNVGIRNSDGEFVLITNPDDLLNDELVESISKALDEDDGKNYYRPYSRIDVDNELQFFYNIFKHCIKR